ncbi:MAG: hypothetical protein MJ252_20765 [archaeon]|nr:hypothetical protein [archaeon]
MSYSRKESTSQNKKMQTLNWPSKVLPKNQTTYKLPSSFNKLSAISNSSKKIGKSNRYESPNGFMRNLTSLSKTKETYLRNTRNQNKNTDRYYVNTDRKLSKYSTGNIEQNMEIYGDNLKELNAGECKTKRESNENKSVLNRKNLPKNNLFNTSRHNSRKNSKKNSPLRVNVKKKTPSEMTNTSYNNNLKRTSRSTNPRNKSSNNMSNKKRLYNASSNHNTLMNSTNYTQSNGKTNLKTINGDKLNQSSSEFFSSKQNEFMPSLALTMRNGKQREKSNNKSSFVSNSSTLNKTNKTVNQNTNNKNTQIGNNNKSSSCKVINKKGEKSTNNQKVNKPKQTNPPEPSSPVPTTNTKKMFKANVGGSAKLIHRTFNPKYLQNNMMEHSSSQKMTKINGENKNGNTQKNSTQEITTASTESVIPVKKGLTKKENMRDKKISDSKKGLQPYNQKVNIQINDSENKEQISPLNEKIKIPPSIDIDMIEELNKEKISKKISNEKKELEKAKLSSLTPTDNKINNTNLNPNPVKKPITPNENKLLTNKHIFSPKENKTEKIKKSTFSPNTNKILNNKKLSTLTTPDVTKGEKIKKSTFSPNTARQTPYITGNFKKGAFVPNKVVIVSNTDKLNAENKKEKPSSENENIINEKKEEEKKEEITQKVFKKIKCIHDISKTGKSGDETKINQDSYFIFKNFNCDSEKIYMGVW